MKRMKLLFLIPFAISSLASCNSEQPLKHTRVENVDEYALNVFSPEPISMTNDKRNFDFFNDRTIPYLSIEEYINDYVNSLADTQTGRKAFSKYVVLTNGKVTTIVNSHNNSKCVVDYSKKTATFDSYSGFLAKSLDSSGPGDYISTTFDDYYFLDKTYSHQKGVEVSVKFSDYHIDSYFYNEKIYLPLHFMFSLFGTSNPFSIGGIYYNGHNSYMMGGGIELVLHYFDATYQQFLKKIRENDTTLNRDYLEYNYNVMCFILDLHYGLGQRNYRSTNETFYFNKEGAYKTLAPYKERLLSTELGVFDDTLIELFEKEFNDGGHTAVSPISVTQNKDVPTFARTGETKYTLDANTKLLEKRQEVLGLDFAGEDADKQYMEMEYDDGVTKTDIAYITFDSFNFSTSAPTLDAPYYTTTFNLINYANEQIRKNDIKNVVIDLACNTGGVILAEEIFESWICGNANCIEYNTKDKSITKVTRKADVNFNKVLDEGDFLPDDVNVYCIISPSSFSCGNLLPTRLKEFSNTKFIGSRSGGGCCSVESNINLPNGAFITISSAYNSILKDSTVDNIKTVDDGVVADFIRIEDGEDHYAEFFDRNAINRKIVESLK